MSFNVWNNLDEIALYLGLERLDSETNESFYNRIRKFGKWKYKTDYYTQVHSIPLQAAMETDRLVKIYSNPASSSNKNYSCKIDWEYFTLDNSEESIRVFIGGRAKLSKILDAIEASKTFSYKLYSNSASGLSCKYIIRNSNIKREDEVITSSKQRLNNRNIVPGSIRHKENIILKDEKQYPTDLVRGGDFFVEYDIGYLEFVQSENFESGVITYKYYDDSFCIESTDINLIPINVYCKYGITNIFADNVPYILNKRVWG